MLPQVGKRGLSHLAGRAGGGIGAGVVDHPVGAARFERGAADEDHQVLRQSLTRLMVGEQVAGAR